MHFDSLIVFSLYSNVFGGFLHYGSENWKGFNCYLNNANNATNLNVTKVYTLHFLLAKLYFSMKKNLSFTCIVQKWKVQTLTVCLCSKRMKRADKSGKGLRHFSMKVCEKVQKKGTTSYNEVADELVTEFTHTSSLMPSDSVSATQ